MVCIKLDDRNSSSDKLMNACLVKTGFLLSTASIIIGETAMLICFQNNFKALSMKDKVSIYRHHCVEANLTEEIELVDKFIEASKDFKKLKHPNNQIFLAYKVMENGIKNLIEEWANTSKRFVEILGLEDMYKLKNHESFLLTPIYNMSETELGKEALKSVVDPKKESAKDGNGIWLMDANFFAADFIQSKCASHVNNDDDSFYFVKMAKLPNINTLRADDLKLIRNSIHSEINDFVNMVNEWSIAVEAGNGKQLMQEKLMPLVTQFNDALNNNELLQRIYKLSHKNAFYQLYLGEVSYDCLLQWFLKDKIISDEVYEYLMDDYKTVKPFNAPVLLLTDGETKETELLSCLTKIEKNEHITDDDLEPVVAKKKSLNFD